MYIYFCFCCRAQLSLAEKLFAHELQIIEEVGGGVRITEIENCLPSEALS